MSLTKKQVRGLAQAWGGLTPEQNKTMAKAWSEVERGWDQWRVLRSSRTRLQLIRDIRMRRGREASRKVW